MPNTTSGAAGVTSVEIDLTGKRAQFPHGTPAGVIGISKAGQAYVPQTAMDFPDFITKFGGYGAEYFGPIALNQWFKTRSAGTFMRVLGAGTCEQRNTDGSVTSAGFVVGAQQVQDTGFVGNNKLAGTPTPGNPSMLGRTYFLGCFMSESLAAAGLTGTWNAAGMLIADPGGAVTTSSLPIVRGVLMVPSGVQASLSGSDFTNTVREGSVGPAIDTTTGNDALGNGGGMFGDVYVANNNPEFVMLLNGHTAQPGYPNVLSASFDPLNDSYFAKKLNTEPSLMERAGHCLYSHFNVFPTEAVVTGAHSALRWTGAAFADYSGSFAGGSDGGPPYNGAVKVETVTTDGYSYVNNKRIAFLVTASNVHNTNPDSNTAVPNYEGWVDRFSPAQTPWIISQNFGNGPQDLFKVVALDDGSGPLDWSAVGATIGSGQRISPGRLKVRIKNIQKSTAQDIEGQRYGSFDVEIRDLVEVDGLAESSDPIVSFVGVNLDPSSDDFVGRRVGDQNTFFNFDATTDEQRLVVEGSYPNTNPYVRVVLSTAVLKGYPEGISDTALPVGFRGPAHLVTSGSTLFNYTIDHGQVSPLYQADGDTGKTPLMDMVTPPVPFRQNVIEGTGSQCSARTYWPWGVQVSHPSSGINGPNASEIFNDGILGFTKFYPRYQTGGTNVAVGDNVGVVDSSVFGVLDSDRFHNNMFTLERVQIITDSATVDVADSDLWQAAQYRRDGKLQAITDPLNSDDDPSIPSTYETSNARTRFLDVSKDFVSDNRSYLQFSTIMQGGFDGTNIFNTDQRNLTDNSCRRESADSAQGLIQNGPTINAYRKAVDIMAEKTATLINLLTIPGLRHPSVTDYAADAIEDRFDAMYIMDIEQVDSVGSYVTSSVQDLDIDVTNTANTLANRNLNTSFAAAYFPDVKLTEAAGGYNTPASVMALATFGLSDATKYPWFAAAGTRRSAIPDIANIPIVLTQANYDLLYDNDINPIWQKPNSGPLVMGNKTLLRKQSALDRINVRRLLIHIRRQVRLISDTILFEPNRASTLANFSAKVTPLLADIQAAEGLDRFKVVIDSTTTTQADIENNTIRGRIILQPTKSIEFIELEFVLTNTIEA